MSCCWGAAEVAVFEVVAVASEGEDLGVVDGADVRQGRVPVRDCCGVAGVL